MKKDQEEEIKDLRQQIAMWRAAWLIALAAWVITELFVVRPFP